MSTFYKNPFFSVVIPLYNKEMFIEDTLKSVLNQTFQDFEIIIVNDGSTDNGLEKIKNHIDKRFKIFTQENLGAAYTRNRGIKEANGHYIALLDADDLWHNNHLLELKKLIEAFPKAELFCNNYQVKRSKNSITPTSFNFTYSTNCEIIEKFFEANIIDCIPTSSSVAFLKSSFNKIGGYNISIISGQDTDLWIRFALHCNIAFNPVVTMIYNNFDNNSLSKSKNNEGRYKLINNYNTEEKTNKSLKKYLDINRYAVAIRCALNNEDELYRKLKREIDYTNLNFKQKTLLVIPKFILYFLRYIQKKLLKTNIYVTAYK